jgi:hypothetical protein
MRTITIHHGSDLNRNLLITADERADGGASHNYSIDPIDSAGCSAAKIKFQKGAMKEIGFNGISDEALLAIIIDRLRGFQSGPFACRENALALTKTQEAMHWLNARTADRMARGVEGIAAP